MISYRYDYHPVTLALDMVNGNLQKALSTNMILTIPGTCRAFSKKRGEVLKIGEQSNGQET